MEDWNNAERQNKPESPDTAGSPPPASGPDAAGSPYSAGSPDTAGSPYSAGSPDSVDNSYSTGNSYSMGDSYSTGGPSAADGWKEKWKKAALPLAACAAVVLIAAGGFALNRGGAAPGAENSQKTAVTAVDSDGAESPSISFGAGAAEFKRMEEEAAQEAEQEAALQSVEDAGEAQEGNETAPAETEAAREEAPPTPAPTEAPRQPSPTPTPIPTPIPTPTEVPPTPEPEPEYDSAENAPSQSRVVEENQGTPDAVPENPWDNVELTLPDDAGYLFARYTPLEEEAGGALYAFTPEQYAALLDSLDAAGFVSHTSVPAGNGTIYVYLETDSAGEWDAGPETDSEGGGETEPDFEPEEGGETGGEAEGGASGSTEVEDFSHR